MKKHILVIIFTFLASVSYSQVMFDITTPFKLWLLNNEARVFSSLNLDMKLIWEMSTPLSFTPNIEIENTGAEEELWNTHRKYYRVLDDIQSIYTMTKRFGNGRLSVLTKQARPEIWSVSMFDFFKPVIQSATSVRNREGWHFTLLKALRLAPERDYDLNKRLQNSISKLSSEEYRLLNSYFSNFSALYPGNTKIKLLQAFLDRSNRNSAPIGAGIHDLLKPTQTSSTEVSSSSPVNSDSSPQNEDNALAELEKIAGMGESDENATFEDTPEPEEDMFNIW
ncbi:MAG: hypothetical protein PHF29_07450 [Candidatus Riflebacteria bacterium]|nr:hypothetical protein [Candidatus Riflebacteria bacterium]